MDLLNYYDLFRYGNRVTCIQSDNLELIEQVLIDSLEKEGCLFISQPPSDYSPLNPYIWVFGLYRSQICPGWTVIKNSAPHFFASSRKGNNTPRLSDLAMEIGCDAFHHRVWGDYWGVLLEVTECGEILASGYIDDFDREENMMFYNEPVSIYSKQNFSLLDVPEEFQQAGKKASINEAERQKRSKEIERIVKEDPNAIDMFISEYKELNAPYSTKFNLDLGRLLCPNLNFWVAEHPMEDSYYYDFSDDIDFRVKLLFFKITTKYEGVIS